MRFSLSLLAFAAGAWAQQSSSSVDSNTGITFQGKTDTTGFYFGMAVPTTVGTDFIGQMVRGIYVRLNNVSLTFTRLYPSPPVMEVLLSPDLW